MNYMLQTIKLAKKASGYTSPNPLVGALLIKKGRIIAQSYHQRAGDDHAEIAALKQAGRQARNAVMYVNLEPCCHRGKTPPCTQAIIKAGIKQVHIAMLDPNPLVAGKGKKELEKAGIKISVGEENKQAKELNEIFIKYITKCLPFVTAKWAMSLDGKIATYSGDSKWISNKKSRQIVHQLRQQHDAVLVGVNTVIKDNPRLNVRLNTPYPKQPIKIIVDDIGRTPLSAKIFSKKLSGRTIIATTNKMTRKKEKTYQKLGAEILRLKSCSGMVNLIDLMNKLAKRKITSVMIEGGGEVLGSAFDQKIIDKAHIFIGPKIIGGKNAKTPIAGQGSKTIANALRLKIKEMRQIDDNMMITAYV